MTSNSSTTTSTNNRNSDRDRDRRREHRQRDYHDQRRSPDYYSSDEDESSQNNTNRRRHDDYDDQDSVAGYEHRRRSRTGDHRRDHRGSNYRSRSRSRDRDDYHRSRSHEYGDHGDNSRHRRGEEPPNHTIMLKGLSFQITENEIGNKVAEAGLKPKDIRLMRRKTGESRGFAFVEFHTFEEAVQWKTQTQGYIVFADGYQTSLHYSIQKDSQSCDRNSSLKSDWTCYKCGVINFKRRDSCFKCAFSREESLANESGDFFSSMPTNCLLLRNLSSITTEERILSTLGNLITMPIKSLKIPKENGVTKCMCFVELYTTSEATQVYNLLSSIADGFLVDDSPVSVCFAKRNISNGQGFNTVSAKNAASAALAAAQWTNQSEVANQAKAISASLTQLANSQPPPPPISLSNETRSAQVIIPTTAPLLSVDYGTINYNGTLYRKYPIPDVSTYQYEETSGYYYDQITCLYYDVNTHYYYNGTTRKYLFWSQEHQTFLPIEAISAQQNIQPSITVAESAAKKLEKSEKSDKNDKVKIAKKIAKDMEKWAKTLNQKKETPKAVILNSNVEEPPNSLVGLNPIGLGEGFVLKESKLKPLEKSALFDSYGDQETGLPESISESSARKSPKTTESGSNNTQVLNLTDWNKLLCLLCKRQFNSREQLMKHQQASELHKTNLFKLTGVNFTQEQIAELSQNDGEFTYRDRAKERRKKYGMPDIPEPSRAKEKYNQLSKSSKKRSSMSESSDYGSSLDATTSSYSQSNILSNSIGGKMLKSMGWSDGQGLGKKKQGRSSIIEVEQRSAGAGLGSKASRGPPGESYKDAVKRTMMERYRALDEQEQVAKMSQS